MSLSATKVSLVLRAICKAPMGVFDTYARAPAKYPHLLNYWTMFGVMFFVTVAGKGAEKFSIGKPDVKSYLAMQKEIDGEN